MSMTMWLDAWVGRVRSMIRDIYICQDLSHKLAKHADAVVILNATFDIQAFHCVLSEFYTYMAVLSNDASRQIL